MRRTLLLLSGLLIAAYFCTGITQIQPGQRGVVRRFGRIAATPGPGLYIGFPWGIDRVDRVGVDRLRRISIGYQPDGDTELEATPSGQLLTGDQNLINIQVVLDYVVTPDHLADFIVQEQDLDAVLSRECEAQLADWVSRHRVDDVLLRGKVELPGWLLTTLNDMLAPHRLGIAVQGASITHLYPPAEVKLAFDEVLRAETGIRSRENQARQLASQIVREAQMDAQRLGTRSEAQSREIRTAAAADADRFTQRLAQYERMGKDNPHYLEAIWWEEMGKLFKHLKQQGKIDLLDHHLAGDGLDITIAPATPKSR